MRNVKGSFQQIKQSIALLTELEKKCGNRISKSICFTISKYNYSVLGKMADVARSLSIPSVNIVPYYDFSNEMGTRYDTELSEDFGCEAFSWRGFHHEE